MADSRMDAYYRKRPRIDHDPESARDRLEQVRREYRDAQLAGCSCGRVRRIGTSAGEFWGGLECRAGKHGIVYLSMAEILTQWRNDRRPGDSPAGDRA